VRRGLLNASNTALQVNGAAYGSGIYLSPTATMSFGYTKNWRSLTQLARHTNPVNTRSTLVDLRILATFKPINIVVNILQCLALRTIVDSA